MTICVAGMFVGIDDYSAPDRQLMSARKSAVTLRDYFQLAHPEGRWRVFPEANEPTNRNEILAAVTEWVKSLGHGEAGVFYYSGHGLISDRGQMVLAARDFKDSIPFDSGIPLRRLYEIVLEHSHPDTWFLFLLDVCREGSCYRPEATPENVTVVYACEAGKTALERDDSTFFVDSLLDAVGAGFTVSLKDMQAVSLQSVLAEMRDQEHSVQGRTAQKIQAHGSMDMLLPVKDAGPTILPECVLMSRDLKEQALLVLEDEVKACLRSFMEENEDFVMWQEVGVLNVRLPPTRRLSPGSLVDYTVMRFPRKFDRLTMRWPGKLRHQELRAAGRFESDYVEQDQGAALAWSYTPQNGQTYKGEVEIRDWERATEIKIRCRVTSGPYIGLDCLGATLRDMCKLFCTLLME